MKFAGITAIAISIILPTIILMFFSAMGANSIMMETKKPEVTIYPAGGDGNEDVFYNLSQAFLILILNIAGFWIIAITTLIWLVLTLSIFSDEIIGFFRWISRIRISFTRSRDL